MVTTTSGRTPTGGREATVQRRLSFYGTGSRPVTRVESRSTSYPVEAVASEALPGDPASTIGTPCPFIRPGCPCGVPF